MLTYPPMGGEYSQRIPLIGDRFPTATYSPGVTPEGKASIFITLSEIMYVGHAQNICSRCPLGRRRIGDVLGYCTSISDNASALMVEGGIKSNGQSFLWDQPNGISQFNTAKCNVTHPDREAAVQVRVSSPE